MITPIDPNFTKTLLAQPETGMGYQFVEVVLRHREARRHLVVFNGQFADDSDRRRRVGEEVTELEKREFRVALADTQAIKSLRVLPRSEAVQKGLLQEQYAAGVGPASSAPIEPSGRGERFLRYSAYVNDARILEDGSVLPGTYVTTHEDGTTYVKTGMDAVRRYALPNPDPAINRFYLRPPSPIAVRRGTVQPANNQPGGGTEVIFDTAAPAGTKYDQDTMPRGD